MLSMAIKVRILMAKNLIAKKSKMFHILAAEAPPGKKCPHLTLLQQLICVLCLTKLSSDRHLISF